LVKNIYIYNGILFSYKEEWNFDIQMYMDGTWEHYIKLNNPSSERQSLNALSHMWKIDSNRNTNELSYIYVYIDREKMIKNDREWIILKSITSV
jgi:hypothetical protein